MTDLVTAIRQYDGRRCSLWRCAAPIPPPSPKTAFEAFCRKPSAWYRVRLPVCVTVTAYLDRLIALSKEPDTVVVSFGDLLRVPGSRGSLSDGKAEGGRVQMVYSPMEFWTWQGKTRI